MNKLSRSKYFPPKTNFDAAKMKNHYQRFSLTPYAPNKKELPILFFFSIAFSSHYIHDKIVLCRGNGGKIESGEAEVGFVRSGTDRWISLFLEELMVWEFIQGLFSIRSPDVRVH